MIKFIEPTIDQNKCDELYLPSMFHLIRVQLVAGNLQHEWYISHLVMQIRIMCHLETYKIDIQLTK